MNRVQVFKALSDGNRLRIIESLQTSEKCGCTLLEELDIAQSTLSHHLKILVESRILESRKDGKWTYYALSDDGCEKALSSLGKLVTKSECYISVCNSCD